jgi:hypothetical protein
MFLHQNDRFKHVVVSGTSLADGTYTFAQLNTAYANNFPATWLQQMGSGVATGSGSLTVGGTVPPPPIIDISFSSGNLTLTWSQGFLLEADNVTGPWQTNTTARSPFTVTPVGPRKFYKLQVQ